MQIWSTWLRIRLYFYLLLCGNSRKLLCKPLLLASTTCTCSSTATSPLNHFFSLRFATFRIKWKVFPNLFEKFPKDKIIRIKFAEVISMQFIVCIRCTFIIVTGVSTTCSSIIRVTIATISALIFTIMTTFVLCWLKIVALFDNGHVSDNLFVLFKLILEMIS